MEGHFPKVFVLPKKKVKMYGNFWLCEVCILPRTTKKCLIGIPEGKERKKNGKEIEIVK